MAQTWVAVETDLPFGSGGFWDVAAGWGWVLPTPLVLQIAVYDASSSCIEKNNQLKAFIHRHLPSVLSLYEEWIHLWARFWTVEELASVNAFRCFFFQYRHWTHHTKWFGALVASALPLLQQIKKYRIGAETFNEHCTPRHCASMHYLIGAIFEKRTHFSI